MKNCIASCRQSSTSFTGRKITKSSLDEIKITVSNKENSILKEVVDRINKNDEIKILWKITNVNATNRLGYSDHGPMHFQIVANYALEMARILNKSGIEMSIVKDFGLTYDHAETVIFLASVMHDVGMSIHRKNHEQFSLFIARDYLNSTLSFLPTEEKMVVLSETLHAIISHSHGSEGKTSTIEGGIVRVADALDMTKGRARISRLVDINNISNHAIENVFVNEGVSKTIEVKIIMTNPAGIFQVDDLVEEKLSPSGLLKYVDIKAYIVENGHEKLFKDFQ
jgi:metal-dependent HD superfamily phosphatase/phosphodiesterase